MAGNQSSLNGTQQSNGTATSLDAVIIGGGFGGCYLMHLLRKKGLSVKIIEALDGLGGTWRANWYPEARVDSEIPWYYLSMPELIKDWVWTERFAGADEIRSFFDHVDRIWNISKDSYFNTRVNEARWNDRSRLWTIKTNKSQTFTCRWFLPCVGTSHKQHVPDFPGLSSFKGEFYHPASWPRDDPIGVMKGKRMAVIGAGATAIQVVQEAAKVTSHLTEFIKTPNTACPMRQRKISPEEVEKSRPDLPEKWAKVRASMGGTIYEAGPKRTFDHSPEERETLWQSTYAIGGFKYAYGSFQDQLVDPAANRAAYDFWARETRKRIPDPAKADILAPIEPPYYFGTKRVSLEQDYYEMVSLPHVDITNSSIVSFDETGINTADGRHHDFDLVCAATGYDSVTGSFKEIGIHGTGGRRLSDKWAAEGLRTYLGMSVHGFPNMFFTYGPQSPSAFTAGTPFIEQQVEWVADAIGLALARGWTRIEATRPAEEDFSALVTTLGSACLIPQTDSWYVGANVPGKRRELLIWLAGMPLYFEKCRDALSADMHGFDCQHGGAHGADGAKRGSGKL